MWWLSARQAKVSKRHPAAPTAPELAGTAPPGVNWVGACLWVPGRSNLIFIMFIFKDLPRAAAVLIHASASAARGRRARHHSADCGACSARGGGGGGGLNPCAAPFRPRSTHRVLIHVCAHDAAHRAGPDAASPLPEWAAPRENTRQVIKVAVPIPVPGLTFDSITAAELATLEAELRAEFIATTQLPGHDVLRVQVSLPPAPEDGHCTKVRDVACLDRLGPARPGPARLGSARYRSGSWVCDY